MKDETPALWYPPVVRWKKFALLSGIAYQRLLYLAFGNPAAVAKGVPHLLSMRPKKEGA